MSNPVRISIVSSNHTLSSNVQLRLTSKGYQANVISDVGAVLGIFYCDPPDLMILDLTSECCICPTIVPTLRRDSFFSTIPIIGIINSADPESFQWEACPLDDFVHLPINFTELFSRIPLSLNRIKRIFDNNPLTRLPGNTSIQRAIEDAMGQPQAVCYVDINHFKPYNDVYGFSHGDEVLRMLARIIFNAVHETGGGFCGHIGGDDFVFIVSTERFEAVCGTVISYFDRIILDLFDEETKVRGWYQGTNRKGEDEQIPLLSISIAVVPMNSPAIQHFAKVAEVAAELKKHAKEQQGSVIVMDQRQK